MIDVDVGCPRCDKATVSRSKLQQTQSSSTLSHWLGLTAEHGELDSNRQAGLHLLGSVVVYVAL